MITVALYLAVFLSVLLPHMDVYAADSTISNLPSATTPLAGTEVLPIVQSGVTKKVAVSDVGGSVSTGSSGAVQSADGSGGFLDSGLTAVAGEMKGKFSYSLTTNGSNTIIGTVDANGAPSASPTVFNRTSSANAYTGSGCTVAPNPGTGDYVDQVFGMGHNLAGDHTRVNTSYGASLLVFESNYCASAGTLGNKAQLEWYLRTIDTSGAMRQQLGMNAAHDGTYGDLSVRADIVTFLGFAGSGTQWQKWDYQQTNPTLDLFTHNGTVTGNYQIIRQQRNNAAWIQQRNAGNSTYLNLPYFDAQDNLRVASEAGVIWDVRRAGTGATNPGYAIQIGVSSTGVAGGDKGFFVQLPTSANWYYGWQMTGAFGDNFYNIFSNTNNATGNAHTKFIVTTGGSSAGDPTFGAQISGVTYSYWGLDNSDNDAWKINGNGSDSNLGTGDLLRIETTGSQKGEIQLPTSVTQANLGSPGNGTMVYCSDCTTATACTSGGGGAMAFRQAGAWKCL